MMKITPICFFHIDTMVFFTRWFSESNLTRHDIPLSLILSYDGLYILLFFALDDDHCLIVLLDVQDYFWNLMDILEKHY